MGCEEIECDRVMSTEIRKRGSKSDRLRAALCVQTARKPNSVLGDHSSRLAIADELQQPTRRFRHVLSSSGRIGPIRAGRLKRSGRTPCLFGLAPCGVYPASLLTQRPVRSYRTVSPLPSSFACAQEELAVCFLLHWPSPGLDAGVPDVIRHTALRSSDFPPPPDLPRERRAAAIAQPPASLSYLPSSKSPTPRPTRAFSPCLCVQVFAFVSSRGSRIKLQAQQESPAWN